MKVELTREQIWAVLNALPKDKLEQDSDLKSAYFRLAGQVTGNS